MEVVKTNIKDIEENFAKFDLALMCEDRYKRLSDSDKILYTLLKNQESLSIYSVRNGNYRYVDSNGYVFVEISQEKLCKLLDKSEPTIRKCLSSLEKVGLIQRDKSGYQKCHKIYVGKTVSTVTLGEYFKKISCEIEEEKKNKNKDKEININATNIKDIEENKKASTVPPVKAEDLKNNDFNNIIPQNNSNDTKKEEDLEIINLIKESCINVKKADLIKYKDEFTDINRFKEAIAICESRNSHGIKALRLAYKYGDNDNKKDNKKQSTIFMADSQVDINGKLKSVTEMTDKEIEEKINQKWGWTF